MPDGKNAYVENLANPVVLIALLILFSVFILIGAAIFGLDRGVLLGMAKAEFARGLITYLFAVVTIGTAVVLVVSALTSGADEAHDKTFQRGKEILSLLLGVFGTIVGFYFGAEVKTSPSAELSALHVTPVLLSRESVVGGESITVTAAVSGATSPYQYGIGLGDESELKYDQVVGNNGWIVASLPTRPVKEKTLVGVKLGVKDAAGQTLTTSAKLLVMPQGESP